MILGKPWAGGRGGELDLHGDTATKAQSNINAAVLSHVGSELILSWALKWAGCFLPQIFKDQGHKHQNLCGNMAIPTWNGCSWQLLNFLFLLPKEQEFSAPLRSHGWGFSLNSFPWDQLLSTGAVHEEKGGTHSNLMGGFHANCEFTGNTGMQILLHPLPVTLFKKPRRAAPSVALICNKFTFVHQTLFLKSQNGLG